MILEMKHEWVKLIASKSVNILQKLCALLELLRDWRNRLEYMDANIREEPEYQYGSPHQVEQPKDNKPRRRKCWLHNLDGEPGEHPIWRCRLFLNKTVQERVNLVTANKACQRCLIVECPGSSDIDKCSRKFTCASQGCGGNHNVLLHTSNGGVHHTHNTNDSDKSSNPILPIQTL